jgi:hypothetical protein
MKLLIAIAFLCSSSAFAFDYELATTAGFPNEEMDFVQSILKEKVAIVPGDNLKDYTTAGFYSAQRNGVQSAVAVQVFSDQGSGSFADLNKGIEQAAPKAAIFMAPVGPHDEHFCATLAALSKNVFLLPIGSDASIEDPSAMPSCFAKNILFVAGLNVQLSDLAVNQTQSPLIRVSAPYVNLTTPAAPGRSQTVSSKFISMGFIAGKMAVIVRAHPELMGAELVDRFLADETIYLPALEGKTGSPRALVNVNY